MKLEHFKFEIEPWCYKGRHGGEEVVLKMTVEADGKIYVSQQIVDDTARPYESLLEFCNRRMVYELKNILAEKDEEQQDEVVKALTALYTHHTSVQVKEEINLENIDAWIVMYRGNGYGLFLSEEIAKEFAEFIPDRNEAKLGYGKRFGQYKAVIIKTNMLEGLKTRKSAQAAEGEGE